MVLLSPPKHLILEYTYDKHWYKNCRIFTGNTIFQGWYKGLALFLMSKRTLPKAKHCRLSSCMKAATFTLSAPSNSVQGSCPPLPRNKECCQDSDSSKCKILFTVRKQSILLLPWRETLLFLWSEIQPKSEQKEVCSRETL